MGLEEPENLTGSSALKDGYELFRMERQGNRLSNATLEYYDFHVHQFLAWLAKQRPAVLRFDQLDANHLRLYRAFQAARPKPDGKPLAPNTLLSNHRAVRTFLRWADEDGQPIDPRMLRLRAPVVPRMEKTVYTITQVKTILAACTSPTEELVVRLLVGSGMRASEVCGLAVTGPDGMPDLMTDSLEKGRAELRVRWDGGAKGKKTRRVPITPTLAMAAKRYIHRHRPQVKHPQLLIGARHQPFARWGIDSLMDRLERRVEFRVHAHAFRHTFATVATQNDWNLEKLRAAMGHADYSVLQRYVSLASERDLGSRKEWAPFILFPEITEKSGW